MAEDYKQTEPAQEEAGPLDGQLSITIDDTVDPKLNPNSPEFDREAYIEATTELAKDAGTRLQESLAALQKNLVESEMKYKKAIATALSNGLSEEFSLNVHGLIDYIQQHREEFEKLNEAQEALAKMQPYIEFELDEAATGEPPITFLDFLEQISGTGEPMNEWAAGILERARQRQAQAYIKSETPSIELAKQQGAIVTLANKVATIASKEMGMWAAIDNFKTIPEQLKPIYDEFGKLNEISIHGEQLQPLDNIHISFLMALLQIAYTFDLREVNSQSGAVIPIYLPKFFKETKIDPRPRTRKNKNELRKRAEDEKKSMALLRRDRFIELMAPLDNRLGVVPGQGHYALARFISWDEKSEVANISIPYELKLVEMHRLENNHGAISNIFHADIINEPNTAVEVANRIAIGVIQRGISRSQEDTYNAAQAISSKVTTTIEPDGTKTIVEIKEKYIEWAARFETIIKDCPQFKRDLERIRTEQRAGELAAIEAGKSNEEIAAARKKDHKTDPQRINKKLQDTFTAAIRIINEKSDMPKYYKSFEIKTNRFDSFKAPTSSTLKDKIIISHKGKNPNYDKW